MKNPELPALPALAIPLHDPDGVLLPQLLEITPQLRALFACVYLSLSSATQQSQPRLVGRLQGEALFTLDLPPEPYPIGVILQRLYACAAKDSPPEQLLHLAFTDRVVFALRSAYCDQFCADMRSLQAQDTPLVFQRSAYAWETHPQNYRILEGMLTQAGELLFGRSLDFAWCHLALTARRLASLLPRLQRHDFSLETELVLLLRHELHSREVDWLAWEDPLIYGGDPHALKTARESDPAEVRKRLSYVIPMLDVLKNYPSY